MQDKEMASRETILCIQRMHRLSRLYSAGSVTKKQFAENAMFSIPPCDAIILADIFSAIPKDVPREIVVYMQTDFKGKDFCPEPWPFMRGNETPDELHAMTLTLRPKYIFIYEALCKTQREGVLEEE